MLSADPPARDRRWRHWAYSLTKAHDSLGIATLDVPWWTYDAIDAVEGWLAEHPEARAFEWGSGASTIWLAKRVASVRSVEHHRGFGESMQAALAELRTERPDIDARIDIVEPAASADPAVPSAKEGHGGLDFAGYVGQIEVVATEHGGRPFDLIVVDGRAREACLSAGLEHLAPGGLVVFDNTRRRRYRDAIAAAAVDERRLRGLTPTLPYPDQTSLLTVR